MSVRGLKDLLVADGHIVPRGRPEITEGKKVSSKKDPVAKFFSPIEKLAAFDVDLFEEKDLTKERVAVLQDLKERIEKLLAKATK